MPRDFLADKKTLDEMPPLSKEPQQADSLGGSDPVPSLYQMPTSFVEDRFKRMTDLHPFSSLLNQDDLDDCDWLEHAAFDANEAATREKVGALLGLHAPLYPGLPRHTVAALTLRLKQGLLWPSSGINGRPWPCSYVDDVNIIYLCSLGNTTTVHGSPISPISPISHIELCRGRGLSQETPYSSDHWLNP